jgi:small ligand-binding sensory domain FIST
MPNSAASRLVLAPFSEERVISAARETLQEAGGKVTCAFVFASADYQPHLADFLELIQLHGHVPTLIGSSGSGLVNAGLEAEQASGFSLLFLHLPESTIHVLELPAGEAALPPDAETWRREAGPAAAKMEAWILLANPFELPAEPWLALWNGAFPGVPVLGGLGSGGARGDDVFLFHDRTRISGGVALGISGGVQLHTLVSQGCRPIGEPLPITGAQQNLITSLGSRPAYQVLTETIENMSSAERARAAGNLFVGLAMSEYLEEFKTGDFLVRNLLGADPNHGVVAIGANPRIGQTLQFQLRDKQSADEELHHLAAARATAGVRPFASLAFVCTGRGRGLFRKPHHDAAALAQHFGSHASAGFFCNGEIGPVGGRNFVHGYTASVALISDLPDRGL